MDHLQTALRNVGTNPHRLIYTTTAATAVVALLAYSRHCYVAWHALGEGGIPHSPRGWLLNVLAHLVARRDPRAVPAPYEKSTPSPSATTFSLSATEESRYTPYAKESHLKPLPPRSSPRPLVPGTVIPQRQTSETASSSTVSRQNAYLASLARSNPSLFAIKPSALESPKFTALWLSPSPSPSSSASENVDLEQAKWLPPRARGETAHVHAEGSAHVCLSLPDAAEVVRKGWGERHRMSGVGTMLPWGYVLLYAPREDEGKGGSHEDWQVWKTIVVAAARVVAKSAGFEGEIVVPE
ncbi:hypothetical protein F5B22DRAFT_626953 [Xylaria bambusicola]|uniref:uncharacterized protein n=1 Tax=Xylaria bambusicola TaxID=326684 RepID=UPI0020084DC7|nr:uncharacterized protein F5B22DRAFT_626953 [Xylaria bambusicola]KAI0505702.1 hypothetical protein F5B22DRAFT_626953 [Xylaria bambusicola]